MRKKSLLFIVMALPSAVFSGNMGVLENPALWSNLATLSFGPANSLPGRSQTIALQPDLVKTYANDSGVSSSLFISELFLGKQRAFNDKISGQIGLTVAGSTAAKLSGEIWEDGDQDFANYNYRYRISHWHVAVKSKLLANDNWPLSPYLSGSIGVGFNRSYRFGITPIIFQEVPAPLFTAYTKTTYTYTLGAGVQRSVTQHWLAGMGYEFSDWGQSNLNPAPGQTTNSGPSLSHLFTQQFQFSITYLA